MNSFKVYTKKKNHKKKIESTRKKIENAKKITRITHVALSQQVDMILRRHTCDGG